MPPMIEGQQEGGRTNPLSALANAHGVYVLERTGDFEVICLEGHSPVSLKELWAVKYQGPVSAQQIQALAAEGVISEEESRRFQAGTPRSRSTIA